MRKEFGQLSQNEIEILLKAPAIVSFLAAIGTGEISQWRKVDSIKCAHLKTFTSTHLLTPYYKVVERVFNRNLEMIIKKYSPFDELSRVGLQRETDAVNNVIKKLDQELATELRTSLFEYMQHVKKIYRDFAVNFFISFSTPGIE